MDERKKNEAKTRKMNTFANRSLPVQLSLAKLFTFRWQFTITETFREKGLKNGKNKNATT